MSPRRNDNSNESDSRSYLDNIVKQKTLFDTSSLQSDPQDLAPVFAEGNFEEHPLFRMSSQERTVQAYSYEWVYEAEDGLHLRKRWTVVPSGQYGAPGPADQDVFVAVMELVARRGGLPESGEIEFSLNELLKVLRKSRGGKSYEALKESLLRLAFTGIESQNSFYSASMKSYIDDTFRIWDVRFADYESAAGGSSSHHTLKFHDVFLNNYFAHYLKNLDTDLYWSLKSPIAKRLYRLIDQKRGQGRFWGQELFELARQIPLTGSYQYASKIKEKLRSPHAELESAGFLKSVSHQGGRVVYEVTEAYSRQRAVRESYRSSPEHIFAVERLISENIRGDVAQSLVEEFGVEHCLYYAESLPGQENLSNPAGWLIDAIRKGYELPSRQQIGNRSQPAVKTSGSSTSPSGFSSTTASGNDSSRESGGVGESFTENEAHRSADRLDSDASARVECENDGTTAVERADVQSSDDVSDGERVSVERQLADRFYQQVLDRLSEEWGHTLIERLFEEIYACDLDGGILILAVPNQEAREYLAGRFKEEMERHLLGVLSERGFNGEVRIELVVG